MDTLAVVAFVAGLVLAFVALYLLHALVRAAENIDETLATAFLEPDAPSADEPFGENTRRVGPPLEVVE